VGLIVHDMRRSAARRLLNAGVDVIDVMKTGGWKGTSMVSRYAIFDRNASRHAMEKLEQYRRAMEALDKAEKINPQFDPSGVERDTYRSKKEELKVQ
jgi:integrase